MTLNSCPQSEAVVRAVRSGIWSEGLRTHIEACKACLETTRVAAWMTEMAANLESVPGELPNPELIWLKAKINRRSRPPERVLLPLKAGGLFGAAGFSLLFAAIPENAWNRIQEWRPGDLPLAQLQDLFVAIPATAWWMPLAAVLLLLIVFTTSEA